MNGFENIYVYDTCFLRKMSGKRKTRDTDNNRKNSKISIKSSTMK